MSDTRALAGAQLTTWGFDPWSLEALGALRDAGVSVRGWSDAYGWALVATGRVDAVVDYGTKPWDLAPMEVILPEAGGRFSAPGGEVAIDRNAGVGTNGRIHDQLLGIIGAH